MIPIAQSPAAFHFDEFSQPELAELFWLEPQEAAAMWLTWGSGLGKHLYDLPDDHWIATAKWQPIGDWLETHDYSSISRAVVHATGWMPSQRLVVIQSSSRMISVTLRCFSVCWRSILDMFDDGPIVVPDGPAEGPVLRFVPLGSILLAHVRV